MSVVSFSAVGRRKKAIARVRLIPGEGNITINKRSLDEYFGLGVDVRGRLVKNHHIGLMHNRPRKGKQLPLSCGEIVAALAHDLVKSALRGVDK